MKYKTIKENLFGECLGSIYIGLIHEFSGMITDAELLSDFCELLWSSFYDGDGLQDELFIGFDEYGFWMSNNGLDPMLNNPRWYRVYTDGDQYCDLIELIEVREREVEDSSSTYVELTIEDDMMITLDVEPIEH